MTEKKPDPTPDDIKATCEELQAGWTEKQRRKHLAVHPTTWRLPEYNIAEVSPGMAELIKELEGIDKVRGT